MNPHPSEAQWSEIRRILEWVADQRSPSGLPLGIAARAGELLPDLFTVRESATKPSRVYPAHRGESATARKKRIREEVRARDKGCTAKGLTIGGALIRCNGALHFEHTWGRGKVEETVENCRMMCARHHDLKQRSNPSRAFWIEHFREHCLRHGYAEEVAHCDRMLALERAQHPDAPCLARSP